MFPLRLKKFYRFCKDGIFVIGFIETEGSIFCRVNEILYRILEKQYYFSQEDVYSFLKGFDYDSINKALAFLSKNRELFFAKKPGEMRPKQLPTITTMTLNLTYICNLRCDYCFEGTSTSKQRSMKSEIAFLAIDLFVEQLKGGMGKIILTGGEPLIEKDLVVELIKYAKQRNICFLIKTNATLLTPELTSFFVGEKNVKLQVSLDGDEETTNMHRKDMHGKGCYEKVFDTLKNIRKSFPDYYSSITVNSVVTKETAERLSRNIEMFESIGIKKYGFKPAMESVLSLDEIARKKYVCDYYWPALQKGANQKEDNCCGIGYEHICIDYDGKIYPCYRLCGRDEYIIGDIIENGLDIKVNHRLASIYTRNQDEECSNCYSLAVCTSGCYSDKLIEENKCDDLAKAIFDDVIEYDLVMEDRFRFLPILQEDTDR